MATIKFEGLEAYADKLRQLGADVEGSIKRAVYPAAGMVIEAIKGNTPVRIPDGGDLRESLALTKYENEGGFVFTKVVFDGYDRNGVPNALKANVLESGSSTRRKHPFIRPAVNRVKRAAELMIETEFNKIIEEKMND